MGRLFGSQRLSDANWPAVFLFSTHQCHWFIWNYKKKFSLGKKGGEEKTHPVDARAWDMARLLVSLPKERVLSSRPEKGVIWPQQSILPCSSHWGSRLVALAGSILAGTFFAFVKNSRYELVAWLTKSLLGQSLLVRPAVGDWNLL